MALEGLWPAFSVFWDQVLVGLGRFEVLRQTTMHVRVECMYKDQLLNRTSSLRQLIRECLDFNPAPE